MSEAPNTKMSDVPNQERLPIIFHIDFVPTSISEETSQSAKQVTEREKIRNEHRVTKLSNDEVFDGIFVFEPGPSQDDQKIVASDSENPVVKHSDFFGWLQNSVYAEYANSGTPNPLNVILTNGTLESGVFAMFEGNAVCVSTKALAVLTAQLLKDPWPALVSLFYTEAFEGLAAKHGGASTFEKYWTISQVIFWITKDQGKNALEAYSGILPPEVVQRLKELLDHLPPPGDLDDSNMSAVTLSDPTAKVDLLNLTQYVEGFKRLILHEGTKTPLTIAILGEWGKGKTSFMRFLQNALEDHRAEKIERAKKALPEESDKQKQRTNALAPRAITVWFDAWQYDSEEKILAALLQSVAKEVEAHFSAYNWLNYRFELGFERLFTSWQAAYHLLVPIFVFPVLVVIAMTVVLIFGPEAADQGWTFAHALTTTLQKKEVWLSGTALTVLYLAWRLLRSLKLPLGLNINQLFEEKDHSARLGFLSVFKEDFQRRIAQMQRMPSWSIRSVKSQTSRIGLWRGMATFVRDIGYALADSISRRTKAILRLFRRNKKNKPSDQEDHPNRIVFFIDDLDRCRANKITDVLEAISVTLDTSGVVFVLGMDDQHVKTGIQLRYKDHIATHKKLYPYNTQAGKNEARNNSMASPDDPRAPDWWPNRYLEKIIQIPFRLPNARPIDLGSFIGGILDLDQSAVPDATTPMTNQLSDHTVKEGHDHTKQQRIANQELILNEIDGELVSSLIYNAANRLTLTFYREYNNPRRVKSFVNRSRLGLYLLKLHFPDLIEPDYQYAIEQFREWESQRIQNLELKDYQYEPNTDPVDELLTEIRQCIFWGLRSPNMNTI